MSPQEVLSSYFTLFHDFGIVLIYVLVFPMMVELTYLTIRRLMLFARRARIRRFYAVALWLSGCVVGIGISVAAVFIF